MEIQHILRNVLKKIRPDENEHKQMNNFVEKLLETSEKPCKIFSAQPMICGSVAKGTWLSKRNELDVFLLFNPLTNRKKLEEHGLTIAREIITALKGTYHTAYAEHPYLCGLIEHNRRIYDVDVVPCYDIKDASKIKSAVDRTPHHVRYVKKNLKLPDEARLLKQFCISAGCYGADVKTEGFSGYLCELLILNYGKFYNCIRAASKWRAGTVIDIENEKVDADKLRNKFKNPLIVIDPVDPNRNVAAAVSIENFYKFVKSCVDFIKRPNAGYFFREKSTPYSIKDITKEFKKRGTRWYAIKFKRPKVIDDILYPQMRRCIRTIEKMLHENGFRVLKKDFWCNENCVILFEMETWLVPKVIKNIGPDVYSRHAEQFLKHYKDHKVFIEGENWVVEQEREFITVLHLLKDLFTKSEKELLQKGIPSKIASEIKKCEIAAGIEVLKLIEKLPKNFRVFMREFFEKNLNVTQ